MNQTGFSFSKTVSDKNSTSVRVSLQSRKRNSKKQQGIEFKILQMNLVMAPTSEKSNMMTCELDLSQHMPNSKNSSLMHKRVFSGGYINNKITRALMP
jgi:hypothetical protein